jgi:type I restriction enzyme S subunit
MTEMQASIMQFNGDMPEGWVTTTLRSVVLPSKAKVEPSEQPAAPYLSLEHIEQDTGRIVGCGKGADVTSTKAVFRAGDVLYGKLRPYLNKVCIPDFDGICSTDILVFPQTVHLDSRYVMRFLMQRHIVEYANHHSAGVQLPRVSFDKLGELEFPLPPFAEQKRIVAKVEALLARVDAARERLAKVPTLLKRFRQSILAAACSGQLTADWREGQQNLGRAEDLIVEIGKNAGHKSKDMEEGLENGTGLPDLPVGWTWASVGQIACHVTDGEHITPDVVPNGVPLLSAKDVREHGVEFDDGKFVTKSDAERFWRRCKPEHGDVLVVSRGATIGRICRVQTDKSFCLMGSVILIKPSPLVNGGYVDAALRSPEGKTRLVELCGFSAQQAIYIRDIRRIPIPLPAFAEQQEIVRRVEALFALADKIEARVQAATARVEKITQAILAKAFRGELVPTEAQLARQEGRAYEPASVLLDRIRAAGETASSRPPHRRRAGRSGECR